MNFQRITLQLAEKLRAIATRQGLVPFDKGDLRKAHVAEPIGDTDAQVSANTPYARAVHDGRPEVKIKVRRKKGKFSTTGKMETITQPKRAGNPWLRGAVAELEAEGLSFMADEIGQDVADELSERLRNRGTTVSKK